MCRDARTDLDAHHGRPGSVESTHPQQGQDCASSAIKDVWSAQHPSPRREARASLCEARHVVHHAHNQQRAA